MTARKFEGIQSMAQLSEFGIAEPVGEEISPSKIDLIIVPGSVFDSQNNRIGYGKGFYDKFLRETTAFKVGVCFNFQKVNEIPAEPHDIKMDIVLYDKI